MYNNNFNSYQQGQFPSLSNGMYQVPQPGVGVGGYPMQPPTNLMQQQSSIGIGGYPMQTGFQQPLPNSAFQTGTYLVNQQLGQQGGYNTNTGFGGGSGFGGFGGGQQQTPTFTSPFGNFGGGNDNVANDLPF